MSEDRKPRQHKTPRARAEEALGVAERKVEKLNDQWKRSKAQTARLSAERDAAILRRDFLAGSPDLADDPMEYDEDPEQDTTTTTTEEK